MKQKEEYLNEENANTRFPLRLKPTASPLNYYSPNLTLCARCECTQHLFDDAVADSLSSTGFILNSGANVAVAWWASHVLL
jgi:hypothetical protein